MSSWSIGPVSSVISLVGSLSVEFNDSADNTHTVGHCCRDAENDAPWPHSACTPTGTVPPPRLLVFARRLAWLCIMDKQRQSKDHRVQMVQQDQMVLQVTQVHQVHQVQMVQQVQMVHQVIQVHQDLQVQMVLQE